MLDSINNVNLWLAATSTALISGVYFAFSSFIMRSLNQLDSNVSIITMNSINRVILRSWFIPLFFGSTVSVVVISINSLFGYYQQHSAVLLSAGVIYFLGMFICTAIINVPLNERLRLSQNSTSTSDEEWSHYIKYWTRWNHVRTISSLIACVMYIGVLVSS